MLKFLVAGVCRAVEVQRDASPHVALDVDGVLCALDELVPSGERVKRLVDVADFVPPREFKPALSSAKCPFDRRSGAGIRVERLTAQRARCV